MHQAKYSRKTGANNMTFVPANILIIYAHVSVITSQNNAKV
jgi:hypothetical protein